MRFKIKTLVDITETRARKGEDDVLYGQQQNFMTLLNTLGLRTNINVVGSPSAEFIQAKEFGKDYKGEQKVWTQIIEVDYEDATNVDFMANDFDLVPVVSGLSETALFDIPVFRTLDAKKKNITFEFIEQ